MLLTAGAPVGCLAWHPAGPDALTGPLKALNLTGRGGRTLDREWVEGPRSYIGIAVAGFPNFFTITGPQSPSVLTNMPVAIEQHVEWVTDVIDHMRTSGKTVIEATREAQDQWVEHVNQVVGATLMIKANSWYMSANIPGKSRAFLPYLDPAGIGGYRKGIVKLSQKIARLCNKERTMQGSELSRALYFRSSQPLNFPQGEGV